MFNSIPIEWTVRIWSTQFVCFQLEIEMLNFQYRKHLIRSVLMKCFEILH